MNDQDLNAIPTKETSMINHLKTNNTLKRDMLTKIN